METNDNIIAENKTCYGVVKDVFQLKNNHKGNVDVSKCDWVDNHL